MSMIGQFIRVTAAELESYLQDSSLLEQRLDHNKEDEPEFLDIDKSWDALSFLLTGHTQDDLGNATPPLSWAILGDGTIDPDQDLGYGPAKYLTPEQVKAVHEAIVAISATEFAELYDANELNANGIYPAGWDDSPSSTTYLSDYFEDLKTFYGQAAKEGQAMILFIT